MGEIVKRDERGARLQVYERYKAGADYEPLGDDLQPVLEMAIESVKAGRPAAFPDTLEGLVEFKRRSIEYLEYLREVNSRPDATRVVPDIEGWSCYIGTTRTTILKYSKSRGEEWQEFIDIMKNSIAATKKQLAFTCKIPPVIAAMDLTNNHDYVNSNEFHLVPEDKVLKESVLSREEIRARYQEIDEFKDEPERLNLED